MSIRLLSALRKCYILFHVGERCPAAKKKKKVYGISDIQFSTHQHIRELPIALRQNISGAIVPICNESPTVNQEPV